MAMVKKNWMADPRLDGCLGTYAHLYSVHVPTWFLSHGGQSTLMMIMLAL